MGILRLLLVLSFFSFGSLSAQEKDFSFLNKSIDIRKNPDAAFPDLREQFNQELSSDKEGSFRSLEQAEKDLGIEVIPKALKNPNESLDKKFKKRNSNTAYIFVSLSMGDDQIQTAFDEAHEMGATVVWRGLKDGEKLDGFFKRQRKFLRKEWGKNFPLSQLNPPLFTEYQIDSVPTIVANVNGKWKKARGTLSVSLARKRGSDNFSQSEVFGQLYDIAEKDLIEVMKQRASKLDWDSMKKGAVRNFWANRPIFNLPKATKNSVRMFDPSVTMARDVIDDKGNVLLRAGTRFNPMDTATSPKIMIIFNSTDADEMERVKVYVKKRLEQGTYAPNLVFMTSSLGDSGQKEQYESYTLWIRDLTKSRLRGYYLQEPAIGRFGIVATPTIIEPAGNQLKIFELGPLK